MADRPWDSSEKKRSNNKNSLSSSMKPLLSRSAAWNQATMFGSFKGLSLWN
ncbi:hypothetical protein YC2023_062807 [Brassica napus]